jgi:hypothetical protein
MKPRSKNIKAIFLAITMLSIACNVVNFFPELTAIPPLFPKATLQPEILHYENEIVAFDYQAETMIFNTGDQAFHTYPESIELGGELLVGLAKLGWSIRNNGELYKSSIGVFRHMLPPSSSLEQVMQSAYTAAYTGKPAPEEVPEQSGPVTVDGLGAVRRTYRVSAGPSLNIMQDIWIEKDGSILRLSLWKDPYQDDFQAIADLFLSSLDIKDDLPPFREQPTPTPTAIPTSYPATLLKHFENNIVSFDYPQHMVIFQPGDPHSMCFPDHLLGGELVVGMGDSAYLDRDKYYRSIRIYRLALPAGSNFELIFMESYRPMEKKYVLKPGVLELPSRIDIGGWTAIQKTYRITHGEPAYELRDIWIPKGDQIYILSIWTVFTNPEDFSQFQSGADAFLNSLVLK